MDTIVAIKDENETNRFFRVAPFFYTASLYPGKKMCKIEAEEISKSGVVVKCFHFYVNLSDTLVATRSANSMPTYFILDEMDRIAKSGQEQW